MKFSASKITDQKRLVRGEHWLYVRRLLRARDERHSKNWRVLILAGGAPSGEITAIRELMPKAHIVAVDIDRKCLEAAIDAGADDVIECDLYACDRLVKIEPGRLYGQTSCVLPAPLRNIAPFDAVHLDFCGLVSAEMKRTLSVCLQQLVTSKGCLILTFSYGRDVVEMFMETGREFSFTVPPSCRHYEGYSNGVMSISLPEDIPDNVAGRLVYLGQLKHLRSVMMYRGAAMPMVSALYVKHANAWRQKMSVVKVEPWDFELATVYPDVCRLYDCPEERIIGFRRKFAALKAVLSRQKPSSPADLIEIAEEPKALEQVV